jgi:Protein of unknown function (DUF3551)
MRNALIALAVIATAVTVSVDLASAQRQPRPWCLVHGGSDGPGGGLPDCIYHSREQCFASRAGSDGCMENPALAWDRLEGKRYATPQRSKTRER